MKKVSWQKWTILALALVICVLIFFPRSCGNKPENLGDLTPGEESELKANLATLKGENDSLRQELGKREVRDSTQRKAHKAAVAPHKKVIKRLERDPEVIQVRDSVPKVDSLLKAKDSVIAHHETRIAQQEMSAQVTKQINEQIRINFERALTDTEKLLYEKELENRQLTKENKKLKNGRALRNIVMPALAVGAFVLGILAGG